MADKIKLAMIGCGGMAGGHLAGYCDFAQKGYSGYVPVATCDIERPRAEAFAARFEEATGKRPDVYTDYAKMLKEARPDAVDIATPHGLHHEIAIACMEAGANVMVEKPIGITVRATRKILDASRRTGKIAATAENIRRCLGPRAMHWAIQDRKIIGDPRYFYCLGVHLSHVSGEHSAMKWRLQRWMSGGWTVIDSGAHYTDLVRYLFGDVDTVSAHVTRYEPAKFQDLDGKTLDADVEDTWMAILRFKSGVVGYWSCAHGLPGHTLNSVVYYGSAGSIKDSGDIFHGFQSEAEVLLRDGKTLSLSRIKEDFLLSLSGDEKDRLFPYGVTNGVHIECFDFMQAVRTGGKVDLDAEEGLKSKAINDAIYEAGATGKTVSVQDVIDCKVEAYQGPMNQRWGLA